jgi:hypothetical protein
MNDLERIIATVENEDSNLIENLVKKNGEDSAWKFYKFLGITFHIYEMNTPIGKANELPIYFKQGSNEKALIKYENYDDYLCFWRCLSYHLTNPKPENFDPRNINEKMKYLFKVYRPCTESHFFWLARLFCLKRKTTWPTKTI